jgi:predicted DNA binding CopG/RHH family protein
MRRKTETAHRQKLSTYRETACKVTKTYTKQKKKIYFRRVPEKRITKSKKPLSKLSKKNLLSVL